MKPGLIIGDMCRVSIHENPIEVAGYMAQWYGSREAVSDAIAWWTAMADALGNFARDHEELG